MESNFAFYVFVLIAIIVGVVVVKKIASCLIKSIILLVMVGLLVWAYFTYFAV